MRICVCTSNRADAEPRAPRHAAVLAQAGLDAEVILFDCAPAGDAPCRLKKLDGLSNLRRVTHNFRHRKDGVIILAIFRIWQQMARFVFCLFNVIFTGLISPYTIGVKRKLKAIRADIYFAHNIDMLLPAAQAARATGAVLIFDCMEFYSDMGGSQTGFDRKVIASLERKWLPRCDLVLASSNPVADEYVKHYGLSRPLVLYNVPDVERVLPEKETGEFHLYWRNAVIDLGQRGLDDVLVALQSLPVEIQLHIQGRLPPDRRTQVIARIEELGVAARVFIHPPFFPEDAVKEAARHTVGLCLERSGNRNQECTVSNKIFDYMMAGLAVVASDMSGLRHVIEQSKAGILYRPADPKDLAEKIATLYYDSDLCRKFAQAGRGYAMATANRPQQLRVLADAVSRLIDTARGRASLRDSVDDNLDSELLL